MSISDMLKHGDFGVGTLDHLDGELVVLDGKAFQVDGGGTVREVDPNRTTPFAAVTNFTGSKEIECPRVDGLTKLDVHLDEEIPQRNHFIAIRIACSMESIRLRSVHRQEPPYRPLAQVAESQSVWSRQNVSGTLVGIRSPAWVGGLNVPGYHWHFLSDDRKVGGHVLDCQFPGVRVRYDVCDEWVVKLEDSVGFDQANLTEDLRGAIKRVETSRGPVAEGRDGGR